MAVQNKLNQLLLEKRLVSTEQLAEALAEQERDHRFFGAVLVERGWVSPSKLLEALLPGM